VTPVSTPEAVLLTLIDTAAAAPGMRVGPAAALTPATSRLRPGKTAKQCFDRFRRIIARPLSVSVTLPSNLLVGSPSAPGAAAGGDPEQGALLAGQAAQAALSSALFHTLRRHAELKRRSGSSSGGDGPKAGSAQRGALLTTAALRQRVEARLQRALGELRVRGRAVVDDEAEDEGEAGAGSRLGAGAASTSSKRRRVEAAAEGAGSAAAAPDAAAAAAGGGGASLRLSHLRAAIAAAVESEAAAAEDEREEAVALAAQATASALGYGGGITVGKDGTASRVVVATLQPLSSASSFTLRRHMGLLAPTGAAGAAYANALATANATGGSHSGALTRFLPLTVGLYRQRPTAAAYAQAAGGVGEMSFASSSSSSNGTRAGLPPALFNHSLHASALGSGVAAVTGSARDNLVCHGLLPTLPMRPRPTWRLATGVLQVKSLKLPAHALNPLTLAGLDTSLTHPGAPASATVGTLAAAVNAAFGTGVQGAPIEAGQVVPRAPSVILPYLHIHRAHSALLPYGGNGGTATAQLTAPPLRPGQPGYVLPAVSHPFALAAGGEPFRRTSPYILALRQRDRERQAMYQQQAQAQAQAAAQAYYQQQAAAQQQQQQQQQQAAAAQQQAAAAQQQQQAGASSSAAGAGAASSSGAAAGAASSAGPSAGGDALADILQKVVSNPGLSNLGIPDSELASLVSQLLSEAMIAEINAISTRPGLSQGEVDEAIMHVILRELQGGGGGGGGGQ